MNRVNTYWRTTLTYRHKLLSFYETTVYHVSLFACIHICCVMFANTSQIIIFIFIAYHTNFIHELLKAWLLRSQAITHLSYKLIWSYEIKMNIWVVDKFALGLFIPWWEIFIHKWITRVLKALKIVYIKLDQLKVDQYFFRRLSLQTEPWQDYTLSLYRVNKF